MTSGGNNFNDFPENQLNKFRAVLAVLRQIRTTRSSVQKMSSKILPAGCVPVIITDMSVVLSDCPSCPDIEVNEIIFLMTLTGHCTNEILQYYNRAVQCTEQEGRAAE